MKPNITIEKLRKSGAKVRVIHLRRVAPDKVALEKKVKEFKVTAGSIYRHFLKGKFSEVGNFKGKLEVEVPNKILAKGGQTVIEVDTEDGKYFKVEATTSNKDVYTKKIGVKICLDRLAHEMKLAGVNI